jgi:hypothetical protein
VRRGSTSELAAAVHAVVAVNVDETGARTTVSSEQESTAVTGPEREGGSDERPEH